MDQMAIRDPQDDEADALASLWHAGWHDAHAGIVPSELVAARTLDRFRERVRVRENIARIRTSGPIGAPSALSIVADDELDQFYLARKARGTGLASVLMADAERIMAGNGVVTAWLACAVGNDRAARFYEKCGWANVATMPIELKAAGPGARIEVWRYEKKLSA